MAEQQTHPMMPPSVTMQPPTTSQCVDWFHEGEELTVDIDGVHFSVRFVGRHGLRSRIATSAPAGANFCKR